MEANTSSGDEPLPPPVAPELEEPTDFEDEELSLGFNQTRLPWLIGAGLLLIYLLTLNRWLRAGNLPDVAQALGWDWLPRLKAPLLVLLTLPVHWLPSGIQPVSLNVLSALLAALNGVLLARCVALLTYDRTREARQRERSDFGLLSIPLSWVPPLFGALTLGLTLTFWEHATAFSGEMLDLLLFGWVVHSLLSYRLTERDGTLYQAAFVYGLAITNNYAMIAFLPCFVIALLWIRGFSFFRLAFLGRMIGLGLAGMLLYLLLPAIEAGPTGLGFLELLRATVVAQKNALQAFPPWIILVLSFTTLLPVLLMGVRWPVNVGDTSEAGAVAMAFFMRLTHIVMLVGPLSILLGAKWGPRGLTGGPALLPLYFLAALAVGYYSGYLLLVFGSSGKRSRRRGGANARLLGAGITFLVLVAAAASPVVQGVRDYPRVRERDGRYFARLASLFTRPLPAEGACLIADNRFELLFAEAGFRHQGHAGGNVLMLSSTLPYRTYHEQMARRFPGRWPAMPADRGTNEVFGEPELARFVTSVARSNQLYYLHPSAGYLFEQVELVQRGLLFEVEPRSPAIDASAGLSDEDLDANEAIWESAGPVLTIGTSRLGESTGVTYARQILARALDYWGVALQRHGRLEAAAKRFQQALDIQPGNLSAQQNLAFNRALADGKVPPLDLKRPLSEAEQALTWASLLTGYGPMDEGVWTFRLGRMLAGGSFFRQALPELRRVHELYPENPEADAWYRSTEAMCWLGEGELDRALALASAAVQAHPEAPNVLDALTQVYLYRRDATNALATLARQLAINPDNRSALLNEGALRIQVGDFAGAVVSMDRLLALAPDNPSARLNRAIARLQIGQLDAAREDYLLLLKEAPEFFAVHYGLAEIAWRQGRKGEALDHYRRYLESARPGTQEYQEVQRRVAELARAGVQP
ncbi:MAG: tetratricopeptide repeat protein [Verrucomicrobiales bacterium]|nr:tetratricopeptide repeat protein [Verrucomicrobiales bacterium]